MKKLLGIIAIAATLVTATASAQTIANRDAKGDKIITMAQASQPTTTVETSAPVTATTTVRGGNLAAEVIQWLQVAFGSTLGLAVAWGIKRGLELLGIKITDSNKAALQAIIVNGVNDAANKAAADLRNNRNLDINVKNQIVADAVDYTQRHGAPTIKALGLDPQSGEAVEAIRARIETALNDPKTPTPEAITPETGKPTPVVANVAVDGTKV